MKLRMLTGVRPTGLLHLGHYYGAFRKFVEMQENYENFILLSDIHMLTTRCTKKDISLIKENTSNIIIDCLSIGVNPENTNFYLQSNIPELTNLYVIIHNFVTVARLNVNPALNDMFHDSSIDQIPLGLLAYPVLEACDIISMQADVVPVGLDNEDHLNVTLEVIERLNNAYDSDLKSPRCIIGEQYNIIGYNGIGKMSKSQNNSIYINDSREDIDRKIASMPWVPYKEESNILSNPIIKYLKLVEEDKETIGYFVEGFLKGKDVEKESREQLRVTFDSIFSPIREKRKEYEAKTEYVDDLLRSGTLKAGEIINSTLKRIKRDMDMYNLF